MKITEPKTPYVRYNAETDQVEGGPSFLPKPFFTHVSENAGSFCLIWADIPSLDLGGLASSPMDYTTSSPRSASPTGADTSGPSSRRTSLSSVGRAASGRSASTGSSRSTSFNLPSEARREIRAEVQRETGEEAETEEEMDEEGLSFLLSSFSTKHAFIYFLGQLLLNMRLSYEPEGATILMKQKR